MKFKIDENLPVEVADVLKQFGHDAVSVYDEGLSGEIDREIGRVCQKEQRARLTLDLDFADIRAYPPQQYAGIVALRCKHQDKLMVLALTERVAKALESETLSRKLWIVDEQRIRIHE